MSRVCVPIDPVDPRIDRFFLKVEPSRDFERVNLRAASVSTGEHGGVHPDERAWRNVEERGGWGEDRNDDLGVEV